MRDGSPLGQISVEASSDRYDRNDAGWRRQVVELRRDLKAADIDELQRGEEPSEGHKAGPEVILLTLGAAGIKAALDVFKAWLQRDRTRHLTLKVTHGDAVTTVELNADTISDATVSAVVTAAVEQVSRE